MSDPRSATRQLITGLVCTRVVRRRGHAVAGEVDYAVDWTPDPIFQCTNAAGHIASSIVFRHAGRTHGARVIFSVSRQATRFCVHDRPENEHNYRRRFDFCQ